MLDNEFPIAVEDAEGVLDTLKREKPYTLFRVVREGTGFPLILLTHGDTIGLVTVEEGEFYDAAEKAVRIVCCYPSRVAKVYPSVAEKIMFSEHDGKVLLNMQWCYDPGNGQEPYATVSVQPYHHHQEAAKEAAKNG